MKDLQELQLGEGGLAQTDEVSVRQIHYPKVGQLREAPDKPLLPGRVRCE